MKRQPVLVIARLTFREAARRKVVMGALVLGILFVAVFGLGLYYVRRDLYSSGHTPSVLVLNQLNNFVSLSGLYVVNLLFAIMAVLAPVDTLSGEIASGTIEALAARPIRRWQIVLGKWLGYACLLTLYYALLASGTVGLVGLVGHYHLPHILAGLLLIWLNGMLMLNLTLALGTRLSTLANGAMALGAYGVAFVGGWIEQFGGLAGSDAAVRVGVISSLLLPCEGLWKRAAHLMASPITQAMGVSPWTSTVPPSRAMVIYGLLYAVGLLALAIRWFGQRDL